jgi:hypoxanthine phosphoribosyltransferase
VSIRVLIDAGRVDNRVAEMAHQLAADYSPSPPVVVGVLNGAVRFMMDLLSRMPPDFSRLIDYDFVGVSTYEGTRPRGEAVVRSQTVVDMRDRHVLVVDGIIDTGATLLRVLSVLEGQRPKSLKVCVLLDKPARRTDEVRIDYTGFSIDDHFVVGYGMDLDQRYRGLPYIGACGQSKETGEN